ncbi:hypothetical protein FNF27_04381 [Cafeteria roenbergensis]|uniref:EGF-like domain-containing protein n=1 Tax=Cafeteria roenbergensis TaxID=33653 RepID=A0A5A8EDY3_CAFRO|nr:hypothetical protein FNF27_04381 [Cafeteria roenbergensis]
MPATDGVGYVYAGWDAPVGSACLCQRGFLGVDCSLRACPSSDDPLSSGQQLKAIRITTGHPLRSTAAAIQAGDAASAPPVYHIHFAGEVVSFPVLATAQQVGDAFAALSSVRTAIASEEPTYDLTDFAGDGKTWTVRMAFASRSDDPWAPHSGSPSLHLFQCDTTGAHNGLRAKVLVQSALVAGTYSVTIDNAAGSTFAFSGPGGASGAGIAISAAGNSIPPGTGALGLTFAVLSGYAQGESWEVFAPGTPAVTVRPATRCDLQDVDFSVNVSGAYTGAAPTEFTVTAVDDEAVPNTFQWTSSEPGSTASAQLSMSLTPVPLTQGVEVKFASLVGHTAGASWRIRAVSSVVGVTSTPDRTLDAFGSPTTLAATYVISIADGTASPNTFQVDGGVATGILANGQSIGNGVTLAWSDTEGFFPGQEWTLKVAAGGAVKVLPRPFGPLEVERAAVNDPFEYVVEIDGEGTGTAGVDTFKLTRDQVVVATGIDLQPYATGNQELGQATLRFFATRGYAVGQRWVIVTDVFGNIDVSPSLGTAYQLSDALEPVFSGLSPPVSSTIRFFVRISRAKATGVAGTFAQFEFSVAGAALVSGVDVHAPTDTTNLNTELGFGIRLKFAGRASYAPGQAWVLELSPPQLEVASQASVREHVMCSRRGLCDFDEGRCTCYSGFTGVACSQPSAATEVTNNEPALLAAATSSTYTGNVLQLQTTKRAAPDFYFLKALAAGATVFAVRGDGQAQIDKFQTGTATVTGGLTITQGGLQVDATGISVASGGVHVANGGIASTRTTNNVNLNVESVVTDNAEDGYTSTLVRLAVTQGPSDLFTLNNKNHYVMQVFDNTVQSTGGAYVNTLLFSMLGNGYTMFHKGGVHVSESGLTVEAGGLSATLRDDTGVAAEIASSSILFTGDVLSLAAARASSPLFQLIDASSGSSSKFSVRGDGYTEVHSGGLRVHAGGATIDAVGLNIVAGGATVQAGGLMVQAGGTTIVNGGLNVNDEGARITDVNSQTESVLQVEARHPTYGGEQLLLSVGKAASSGFKFVAAKANAGGGPETWFSMDGRANMMLGHVAGGVYTDLRYDGLLAVAGADLDITTNTGHHISVKAGDDTLGSGGSISMTAGSGQTTHKGGDIVLQAGEGSQTSGVAPGGSVLVTAGASRQAGGHMVLSTAGESQSGSISIVAGPGMLQALYQS